MTKSRPNPTSPSIFTLVKPYFVFVFVYVCLIFALPANKMVMSHYNFTSEQYHIVLFLVLLPYMLVWAAAFYGYAKLAQYAALISTTQEGSDFANITRGSMWLAYGLPIPALVAICLNSIANSHPAFLPSALIIVNYLSLIIPLVAYTYIRKGTHGLTERTKTRFTMANARTIVTIFILLGVAFCFFTFRRLDLDSLGSSANPYHLPAWLMIVSLLIPYLYAWFSGLIAAYEMVLFSRQVQGVFYRQAMRLLAGGLLGVIASGVGLQYLRTVVPRTGSLGLNASLLITNVIYLIMALGFALLIVGAAKLIKIEEV